MLKHRKMFYASSSAAGGGTGGRSATGTGSAIGPTACWTRTGEAKAMAAASCLLNVLFSSLRSKAFWRQMPSRMRAALSCAVRALSLPRVSAKSCLAFCRRPAVSVFISSRPDATARESRNASRSSSVSSGDSSSDSTSSSAVEVKGETME